MNAPTVSLLRQESYDNSEIEAAIRKLLLPLGGMEHFIQPGMNIVLKPNLVMGRAPELAVTTHPAIVRAVAKLALECGGKISIGDSPGIQSGRKAGQDSGIAEVADELGLNWIEFTAEETVSKERMFKRLNVAKELLEADLVINLPKLKTHAQMTMTMAVKNMFGSVVGTRKFQWHYRAGTDTEIFGRMLYEIYSAVSPGLNIMDAVVGMDGLGPTSGDPNPTGFLAASADACSLDAVMLDILNIKREQLPTLRAAKASGNTAWENAVTAGDNPSDLTPKSWDMPKTQSLYMHGPEFMKNIPWLSSWMRKQISQLPSPILHECRKCGACVRVCPAKAITIENETLKIDSRKCIRCYCCHELCPYDALELKTRFLGRLLERWF